MFRKHIRVHILTWGSNEEPKSMLVISVFAENRVARRLNRNVNDASQPRRLVHTVLASSWASPRRAAKERAEDKLKVTQHMN